MGHIRYACDVGAPVEPAFSYTATPGFVPHWMHGVTAIRSGGEPGHGIGARYSAKARLFGVVPLGLDCEVTEHRANVAVGYTMRSRWGSGTITVRFDPLGHGSSVLTTEADYSAPRGWLRRPRERVRAAFIGSALRRSEARLRREIEEFHSSELVSRIA